MDFLLTVIGNAVVDPEFRRQLLADPQSTIDRWGLRLIKGDVELMEAIFKPEKVELRVELKKTFEALEDAVYKNIEHSGHMCKKPCRMSIFPPRATTEEQKGEAALERPGAVKGAA
jgi:hypothetical protein